MAEFAVCVTFKVKPEVAKSFAVHVADQAHASLGEPGCRVFDVWHDAARSDEVFLYEIYADEAAFAAHLKTRHFRSFDETTRNMITEKTVVTWSDRDTCSIRAQASGEQP